MADPRPSQVAPPGSGGPPRATPNAGAQPFGLYRSTDDRVLAGVAAGVARRVGVDAVHVRVALVVLTFAGGAGLLVYLVAWAAIPEAVTGAASTGPEPSSRRHVAFGLQVVGALLVLRGLGLWLGDAVVWPAALAGLGSGVIWTRSTEDQRERWQVIAARWPQAPVATLVGERVSAVRLGLGALLVASGIVSLLAANDALYAAGTTLAAMMVALLGLGLVLVQDCGGWDTSWARSGASGSAPRSARRWPRTSMTPCCTPSR